jgi:hypothetical protein
MSIDTIKLNHSHNSNERFDSIRYLNLLENIAHLTSQKALFESRESFARNRVAKVNTHPRLDLSGAVNF